MDGPHTDGAREQIHLPAKSLLPLVTAVALTVVFVGLIFSWYFVAVGGAILVLAVVRWIRTVRDEIDSLPSERRS